MIDSKSTIQVGHTMQVNENTFVRFDDVYEYEDYLIGPNGTLVISQIPAKEINTKKDR